MTFGHCEAPLHCFRHIFYFKKCYSLSRTARRKRAGKKNLDINPGQPVGKGREKKTLVLTLGSPSEKGGKKKTLVLTLGRFCRFWEGGHTDLPVLSGLCVDRLEALELQLQSTNKNDPVFRIPFF